MPRTHRGFTLIELLVVIAIIAILAAVLFPVFARARKKAEQAQCLSNVKQLALSVIMYASDNDQRLPPYQYYSYDPFWLQGTETGAYIAWQEIIYPYVKNPGIYSCPGDRIKPRGSGDYNYRFRKFTPQPPNSYGFNYCQIGQNLSLIGKPGECFMLGDCKEGLPTWFNPTGPLIVPGYRSGLWAPPNNIADRHQGGANCAFMDGHAKWLDPKAVPSNPDPNYYYLPPYTPCPFWDGLG